MSALGATWRKSSRSDTNGACVEARYLDGRVEVRDTKDGGRGPILVFTAAGWDAFIAGAHAGDFDQR